jgi:hypothetical protein
MAFMDYFAGRQKKIMRSQQTGRTGKPDASVLGC